MSNIASAFENGKAFIGFLTGGDPSVEKSCEFILGMERAGADLVEIGIPFSDPVAEGPVIQAANLRALDAGTDMKGIFRLVRLVRERSDIPLVFLTYLNPVFRYGYDAFFNECRALRVGGVIFPDLPFEEKAEAADVAVKYGVDVISMVAPTSAQRVRMIASGARGFLYVVSSMGVTGVRGELDGGLRELLAAAKSAADIPAAVGFGVGTPARAAEVAKIADGVIVGSAIVSIIAKYGENAAKPLYEYVKSMKDAIKNPPIHA